MNERYKDNSTRNAWIIFLILVAMISLPAACQGDHTYNSDPQNVGYGDNYCWEEGCP